MHSSLVAAAEPGLSLHAKDGMESPPNFQVLPASKWQAIESSVDRAIHYMLTQQHSDGSFGVAPLERPAVTSLVAMAMISRGHLPDESADATRESKAIVRAIDYVLSRQGSDGMLGEIVGYRPIHYAKYMTYNHAICGLFLSEIYGMVQPRRAARVEVAVSAALKFLRQEQTRPMPAEREADDRGGWRYLGHPPHGNVYADLSVSSWYVMFMRSAESAGFDVPVQWASEAIEYVLRCYDSESGSFCYYPQHVQHITRATVGAGVVSLFLTGHKDVEMEKRCGRWLQSHPFDKYNVPLGSNEHYHYSAYYASAAAMQIGGATWEQFYPTLVKTYVEGQNSDGSWQVDQKKPLFGNIYSTSLAVLALTPPYQLLPIYQR